jgi:ribose transport system permease protein
MSTSTTPEFTNIARLGWHRRGFFAGQTAYVTIAFIVICALAATFSGNFTTSGNLLNISRNFSYIAIMSLGMTVVIITGGIDLSVGSVCALVAVCSMITMRGVANSPLAAIPYATIIIPVVAGLLLAAVVGLINGLAIALLDLSPFVTTLGMLSICRGLTYVITQGRGQAPSGSDAEIFYALTNGRFAGLPVQVVYMLVAAVVLGVALHHSVWGRHLFAVGGSEPAAMRTGIRVNRVKISAYMLCSLAAGAAGILLAGWLGSAPANLASGYELRVIAATVIGGANLAGGSGGPVGAVIGAALIEVIRNSLVLGRVDAYWQDTLIGLIIILAVLVDKLRVMQAK